MDSTYNDTVKQHAQNNLIIRAFIKKVPSAVSRRYCRRQQIDRMIIRTNFSASSHVRVTNPIISSTIMSQNNDVRGTVKKAEGRVFFVVNFDQIITQASPNIKFMNSFLSNQNFHGFMMQKCASSMSSNNHVSLARL